MLKMQDRIWSNYSTQLYYSKNLITELEKELGVPVEEVKIEVFDDNEKKKYPVDKATCEALRQVVDDNAAFDCIVHSSIPDYSIDPIKELIKHKDGLRLCNRAIQLAKLRTIRRDALAAIVIGDVNREKVYVDRMNGRLVEQRKAEGAKIVEMEQAGCIAIAQYRNFDYGAIIYGGDDVSQDEWDTRSWDKRKGIRYNLVMLCKELVKEI